MNPEIRLLAVTRKPDSASYQQRIENWIEPLAEHGIAIEPRVWPDQRRLRAELLQEMGQFDAVWWHRNIVSASIAKRVRRAAPRLVVDFDDPLSFSSEDGGRPSWSRRRKFNATVGRADASLVGSRFLAELAEPFGHRVEVVPMAVDLPAEVPARPATANRPVTLLWLGSKSTQAYLADIRGVFAELSAGPDVRLLVVGGEPITLPGIDVEHRPWSPQAQDTALAEADLGLCPMPDTFWTRGKCPYKVLQYMAWGLPWIGSAVGENHVAAGPADAPHGLLASSAAQWVEHLQRLISDAALRQAMGTRGRSYIETNHSRAALTRQLVDFWQDLVRSPPHG